MAIRFGTREPAEIRAHYPTAMGIEQNGTRPNVFGGEEPLFRFLDQESAPVPIHEVTVRPYYSPLLGGDVVLRPKVGAGTEIPSEFLTVWALLFCLSELARYYPDIWILALDPDKSMAATTLEHGLDLALERTPALVGEGLSGPINELIREDLRAREREAEATVGDSAEPALNENRQQEG